MIAGFINLLFIAALVVWILYIVADFQNKMRK